MIGRAVSLGLGVAIAVAVIWYLVTPEVVRELRTVAATASWPALALATIVGGTVQWLRAWRFAIMTSGALALPGAALVRIAFQLNFLNFALPFRLGELGYPILMRRAYGQPVLAAAGILLLARIYDLCTVGAILAAMSAALGLAATPLLGAFLWIGSASLALAPIVMVLLAHALSRQLATTGRLPAALHAAQGALAARLAQLAAIALSFATWLVFGALAALAANAVADIPPTVALLGASAGNLAFALPINGIGGLGPSQAAWAALVNQAGVPWTDAVISALAVYAVTFAGAMLFGGAAMLASRAAPPSSRQS